MCCGSTLAAMRSARTSGAILRYTAWECFSPGRERMRPMNAAGNSATTTSSCFSTLTTKMLDSLCRHSVPVLAGAHGWTPHEKVVCAPSKRTTPAHPILCRRGPWWYCWNDAESAKRKSRMKRRYNMPFGAECRDDGSVRFRFSAPAARKVEVELSLAGANRSTRLPLEPCDQGWFELATDAAKPGTQYHFRIDGGQEVSDPASRFQARDVRGGREGSESWG